MKATIICPSIFPRSLLRLFFWSSPSVGFASFVCYHMLYQGHCCAHFSADWMFSPCDHVMWSCAQISIPHWLRKGTCHIHTHTYIYVYIITGGFFVSRALTPLVFLRCEFWKKVFPNWLFPSRCCGRWHLPLSSRSREAMGILTAPESMMVGTMLPNVCHSEQCNTTWWGYGGWIEISLFNAHPHCDSPSPSLSLSLSLSCSSSPPMSPYLLLVPQHYIWMSQKNKTKRGIDKCFEWTTNSFALVFLTNMERR